MRKHIISYILIAIILLVSCSKVIAEEISVGIIRDLSKPLEEIKIAFEKKYPEHYINCIYLNERELVNSIKNSKPFISVIVLDNISTINNLAKFDYINSKTIKKLGNDNLCIVVKKSITIRPFMLYPKTGIVNSLAISNPDYTSLGKYTKEALTKLSLWKKLKNKLVLFQDSEKLVKAVQGSLYDGGITYCSYAKDSFVYITDVLNPGLYSKIVYSSAINSKVPDDSPCYKFNNFLTSKTAVDILNKYHIKLLRN